MNRQVSNRRLLKLAAFLRSLPRRRFDYSHYVGDDWKGAQDLSCGTTACALGWAATMPEFRRAGLRLARRTVTLTTHPGDDPIRAAERVFGLEYGEAAYLFEGWNLLGHPEAPSFFGATPKQVARHIERFVKDRQRVTA